MYRDGEIQVSNYKNVLQLKTYLYKLITWWELDVDHLLLINKMKYEYPFLLSCYYKKGVTFG